MRRVYEEVIKSVEALEFAVHRVALKPRPEPELLLDVTMRVLAEEDRLESILERGKLRGKLKMHLKK